MGDVCKHGNPRHGPYQKRVFANGEHGPLTCLRCGAAFAEVKR